MSILNQLRFNAKIAVLAIAALLVPVFVQLGHAMPTQANNGNNQAQFIVICTTAGMMLKQVEQENPSKQSQNKTTNETDTAGMTCPVCISFEIGSDTCLANPIVGSIHLHVAKTLVSRVLFQPLVFANFNASHPRAPPFFQTI